MLNTADFKKKIQKSRILESAHINFMTFCWFVIKGMKPNNIC